MRVITEFPDDSGFTIWKELWRIFKLTSRSGWKSFMIAMAMLGGSHPTVFKLALLACITGNIIKSDKGDRT